MTKPLPGASGCPRSGEWDVGLVGKRARPPAGRPYFAGRFERWQGTAREQTPPVFPQLAWGIHALFALRRGGKGGGLPANYWFCLGNLVLPHRIELWTSPLPRGCSTTELRQQSSAGLTATRFSAIQARWNSVGCSACLHSLGCRPGQSRAARRSPLRAATASHFQPPVVARLPNAP